MCIDYETICSSTKINFQAHQVTRTVIMLTQTFNLIYLCIAYIITYVDMVAKRKIKTCHFQNLISNKNSHSVNISLYHLFIIKDM